MIDGQVASTDGTIFHKTLDAQAFYLKDHVVAGQIILPGVGHLELARAAGELAGARPVRVIRDVMWLRPLVLDGARHEVQIALTPEEDGADYQIRRLYDGRPEIYSRGKLDYRLPEGAVPEQHDLDAIRARCRRHRDHESFYRLYREAGFHYGPSFRVNGEVHGNDQESLGKLILPAHLRDQRARFGLHPSLLDAALQAISGMQPEGKGPQLSVPFALGRVELFAPLTDPCFSYATLAARRGEIVKFNVAILDERGATLVRISDFSARAFKHDQPAAARSQAPLHFYSSTWVRNGL
jgi:polyketide synthase PksN